MPLYGRCWKQDFISDLQPLHDFRFYLSPSDFLDLRSLSLSLFGLHEYYEREFWPYASSSTTVRRREFYYNGVSSSDRDHHDFPSAFSLSRKSRPTSSSQLSCQENKSRITWGQRHRGLRRLWDFVVNVHTLRKVREWKMKSWTTFFAKGKVHRKDFFHTHNE